MRSVTDDVIDVLRAGGLTVGDGVANTRKDGKGQPLTPPYVVVYPLGDSKDGTLGDPWNETRSGLQPTCVGTTREQAEWLADLCTVVLAAHEGDWWVQVDTSGPVGRDDDTGGPPLFYAYPRFTIHT